MIKWKKILIITIIISIVGLYIYFIQMPLNVINGLKAKEYKVENYYIISKKDEIKTIGIYNSDNNNYKTQQKI